MSTHRPSPGPSRLLVIIAATLAGGCFSEPDRAPPQSTDGGSTGATSATDLTSSTTQSSGMATGTSGTTGSECGSATPALLNPHFADIIIGADPAQVAIDVQPDLNALTQDWIDAGVSASIIGPPSISPPITPQCIGMCGGDTCGLPVTLPTSQKIDVVDAPPQPLGIFGGDGVSFDCIFRDDRDAIRNIVLVTDRPDAPNAGDIAAFDAILGEGRFHLVCPGCEDGSGSLLDDRVYMSGGEFGDLSSQGLSDLLWFIGQRKAGCAWPITPPPGYQVEDLEVDFESPDLGISETMTHVESASNCATWDGDLADVPLEWFVYQEGVAGLCPTACAVLQYAPYESVELSQYYCG